MNFQHNKYYTMIDGDLMWVWQHDYTDDTKVWDKGVIFLDHGLPKKRTLHRSICLVDWVDEEDTVFREATTKEINLLKWYTND